MKLFICEESLHNMRRLTYQLKRDSFNRKFLILLFFQCQIGVLPLGTGNDLSRVLGWGAGFDDDAQLPSALDRLEHAQIKILDRWSILSYEGMMPGPRKSIYQVS